MYRSGFISLIGSPNVGKSTLMNKIVGQKVSIVSAKAQTTRNRIIMRFERDGLSDGLPRYPGRYKP